MLTRKNFRQDRIRDLLRLTQAEMAQLLQSSRAQVSLVEIGKRMFNGVAHARLNWLLNALYNTSSKQSAIAAEWESERRLNQLPVIHAEIVRLETEASLLELQVAEMRKSNARARDLAGTIDALDFSNSGVFGPGEAFWKEILLQRQKQSLEQYDYLKQLRVHSKIKSLRAEARALREGVENWETAIERMRNTR